jgi:hypothetical protein
VATPAAAPAVAAARHHATQAKLTAVTVVAGRSPKETMVSVVRRRRRSTSPNISSTAPMGTKTAGMVYPAGDFSIQ